MSSEMYITDIDGMKGVMEAALEKKEPTIDDLKMASFNKGVIAFARHLVGYVQLTADDKIIIAKEMEAFLSIQHNF